MQFANNENGLRTYIGEADATTQYYCPYCNAPMIQRRGQINTPHFAHMKGYLCTDSWKYEEMSEWHVSWQSYYPLENQEVAVINDLGRHRADVLINNTVVEFQHSPISAEEFQERNEFYTACGYKVIWLFDVRDVYQANLTVDEYDASVYRWKHSPKMLTGFDLYGKVQVFFHLQDETQEENGVVIRLTWCLDGELSFFKSAPSECYTEVEFVELTSVGTVQRATDMSGKDELTHRLHIISRKNGETECYGCPINSDGFAPQIHQFNRTACDECSYCRSVSPDQNVVECSGRFREHLEQIETVLETNRIDGAIYTFTYIAKDGSIRKAKVDIPDTPALSIIELAREYNAGVMIVQNVRTGHRFMITKDLDEMITKYSRVYGYYWNMRYNCWSKRSDEIFGPWKPEWIVVWFKTKEQAQQYRSRYDS